MKKMLVRLIAVVALAALLAGCSGGGDKQKKGANDGKMTFSVSVQDADCRGKMLSLVEYAVEGQKPERGFPRDRAFDVGHPGKGDLAHQHSRHGG